MEPGHPDEPITSGATDRRASEPTRAADEEEREQRWRALSEFARQLTPPEPQTAAVRPVPGTRDTIARRAGSATRPARGHPRRWFLVAGVPLTLLLALACWSTAS